MLQSGAKAEIARRAKRESAISSSPVGVEDLERWFQKHACTTLTALGEGRVLADDAVAWYRDSILKRFCSTLDYPQRVLNGHGPRSLLDSPRLFVGTIHSFKGGEADSVMLFPDLSPAGMRHWMHPGPARDSVLRTMYVGMTRAREKLVLAAPSTGRTTDLQRYAAENDEGANA